MAERKMICLGDGATGKTCYLIKLSSGTFPDEYVPTVFDTAEMNFTHSDSNGGKQSISLGLWDVMMRSEEAFVFLPFSMDKSHIVLLMFSVVSHVSFESIKTRWMPAVEQYQRTAPHPFVYVLVGTKTDLRDNREFIAQMGERNANFVSPKEAEALAKELGCSYVECSALTGEGVESVVECGLRDLDATKPRRQSKCTIL